MRLFTFILLLVLGTGCSGTKNAAMKLNQLNGTWVPILQEMGGVLLPKAMVEKQKLDIRDSTYTVIAESIDKGVLKYGNIKMEHLRERWCKCRKTFYGHL